jgi:two-component system, chemotaxis family, chemotaxis protein CheY
LRSPESRQGGSVVNVLVIDDSVTMRRIIRNHLSAIGLDQVIEAADGESALAAIARESIDLVITDWAMPSMCGPDLVRAIRSSPTHGKLPVIMVTGIAEKEHIVQAIEAGVDGYVVKPFEPAVLKEKIDKVVGGLT